MNFSIVLSPLDEQRFGVQTAKASHVTLEDLPQVDSFCRDNHVQFLSTRVNAAQLKVVQAMEAEGFRLMDTLLYYAFKYAKKTMPDDTSQHRIRAVQSADVEEVIAIASESFKGYYGHYHADPRLPDAKCDAVYVDWAGQSVQSREIADEVLVVEGDSQLKGFATLRMNTPQEGEGVLFGVAPFAQGQGIYRTMMIHGMQWCQQQDAERMVVSTQITNVAVQKVWARLGFEFDHAYYTLHKWFE